MCAIAFATYLHIPWFWKFCTLKATDNVLSSCKPTFQKKANKISNKTNHKNSYFDRVLYLVHVFICCQRLDLNPTYNKIGGEITRLRKVNNFQASFPFKHPLTKPYHLLDTLAFHCIQFFFQNFEMFLSEKMEIYRLSTHALIFVVNNRPARTFWNSTHCLLSPFKLDWLRKLFNNPLWHIERNTALA